MLRYVIRRILYAVPILIGVSLVTFLLFYATVSPEQMARSKLSARNPTRQQIQEWIAEHGYDKPLPVQFRKHMAELFLFRFGKSDVNGEPIWGKLRAGVGPSSLVAALVFFASLVITISLALVVAYFRGTYLDAWSTFLCVLAMSVTYLVYIMAGQFVLGKVLKLFPLAGYQPGVSAWRFALLPMVIGVVSGLGSGIRFYRTIMLDEMNQDYVRTARAKGVSERAVLFRHVLKNASIPILTNTVLSLPFLLMGSLLLESFFGIPGLGTMTVDAINGQDFAVVRAMVFLGTVLYIIGAVLTDISYALVDPRVRLE
ncbi:MAG: ABC transporter permease [Armatimonadetes bacterium]|nr:ABC transporter permease [Armatimonadota bacterium]